MTSGPAALLPSASDTAFLRACLLGGAPACDAWTIWVAGATRDGTPARRALAEVNEFLPLLAWNLSQNGVRLDAALRTHLRSAHLTEELRWNKYRDIRGQAFALLDESDIPFIALKGSVVGELAYPVPLFRHADDIDVLLHEDDLPRAGARLAAAGWMRREAPPLPSPKHLPPLVHAEGVPIELHSRLLIPWYSLPYDRLWNSSQVASIGGRPVRVLSGSDLLLHAVAHGLLNPPDRKWVVDAWFMLQRAPDPDWDRFLATTIKARLCLPVSHGLRYLADSIGAPVPVGVLEELAVRASRVGYAGRSAARPWRPQRLFPPPVQFALHYDVPVWSVPFYYAYRLARYVLRSPAG